MLKFSFAFYCVVLYVISCESRKHLTRSRFRALWLNQWASSDINHPVWINNEKKSVYDQKDENNSANETLFPLIAQPINARDNLSSQIRHESISNLTEKYGDKVACIRSLLYPQCEIYLCGTLHVANASIEMVREVIQLTRPNYVVLELCEERVDTLLPEPGEPEINTFVKVLKVSWEQKSLKTFCMEMFALMQNKGARLLGSKVGGELTAAAIAGHQVGSTVVLGDRAYSVTMQRIQDRLSLRGKITVAFMLLWETLTMTLAQMKHFAQNSHNDLLAVKNEVAHFKKHLPVLADVVIFERDAYIARSIADVASLGFGRPPPPGTSYPRGKVLAIVGAGHLAGIRRHLLNNSVNSTHMHMLASSSAHNSTWAGPGMLHVVDIKKLYDKCG